MKRVLVFGASGQIGDALLPMFLVAGAQVVAVSRQARHDREGLAWIVGALDDGVVAAGRFDAVCSLGPLDAFARWQVQAGPIAPRVIAFGSTSVATKAGSGDPHERDVVQRLRDAEAALSAFAAKHDVATTVLRPTLIYGRGRDRNLTRIVAIARRHRLFALPRNATGLRQPVHADDLARAAFACVASKTATRAAYDLPGGEALRYDEMVRRTLAVLPERPRLLRLPGPLFRAAVAAARGLGMIEGFSSAMLARLDSDLVFDASAARSDFSYSPRAFLPDPAMFEAPR